MRVALVHDWLTVIGGAERVLKEFLDLFPQADIFSVVDFLSDDDRVLLHGKRATTTFVQRMPFARSKYRSYLPVMPIAIEQLDLSSYDLVVSSSYAVAKGVLVSPNQVHISYVHSPMRYAWDLQNQYLKETGMESGLKSVVVRILLHYMRIWDFRTSVGPDVLIANSKFVAKRIRKVYGRDAVVVHPPVDVTRFEVESNKEDFYLTASRLVPYKKISLIVEAFSTTPSRKLVVIGSGPDLERIKKLAAPNVQVLGYQPDEVLISHLKRAKAFVFAAEEDFGIAPLEAQACGTPVIALGRGGALETVKDESYGKDATGTFFQDQTIESLLDAVSRFEKLSFDSGACRRNAEGFSSTVFKERFMSIVKKCCD